MNIQLLPVHPPYRCQSFECLEFASSALTTYYCFCYLIYRKRNNYLGGRSEHKQHQNNLPLKSDTRVFIEVSKNQKTHSLRFTETTNLQ